MVKTGYKQCVLKCGNKIRITFVPVRLAHKGKEVKVLVATKWQNGWVVDTVYTGVYSKDQVAKLSTQSRGCRGCTDI